MSYADTVSRVMAGSWQNATPEERSAAVSDLIQVCSIGAAACAVQPFPLLDIALLAPIQIGLVQGIGRIHGYDLDKKSVIEILSTFGASLVSQHVVMAACKLVPVVGWVMGVSMSYALTYAIGDVSDHYFRTGRGVSSSELKEMFKRTYEAKKAEKQSEHAGDRTLRQKLEQLKDAYASGLLSEEEFARMKEELLNAF
jgi:uncharacterized protein (DUF697 family)